MWAMTLPDEGAAEETGRLPDEAHRSRWAGVRPLAVRAGVGVVAVAVLLAALASWPVAVALGGLGCAGILLGAASRRRGRWDMDGPDPVPRSAHGSHRTWRGIWRG